MSMKRTALAATLIAAIVGTADAQTFGAFRFIKNADSMSDADRSFIVTEALSSSGGRSAAFAWRCMSDGLNVSYAYGKYLMGSNGIRVQYRFGEAPPASSQRWDMATEKRAAFMPIGEVANFTNEARSVAKVTLRVTDRDGEALTDVFSLQGLSEALRSLSCYRPADSVTPKAPGQVATRFVVSVNERTVQDNETTLTWQQGVAADGITWEGAYNYCESLQLGGYEKGWRLPTLKELQSLIFEPKKPSLMYIDPVAFPRTPSEFFWTASANDTRVAAVFFDMSAFPTGLGPNKSLGHVRCVRGTLIATYKVPDTASYNLMMIPRPVAH